MTEHNAGACEDIFHQPTLCANSEERRKPVLPREVRIIETVEEIPVQRRAFKPSELSLKMNHCAPAGLDPEEKFEGPESSSGGRAEGIDRRLRKQHQTSVPFSDIRSRIRETAEEPFNVVAGDPSVAVEENDGVEGCRLNAPSDSVAGVSEVHNQIASRKRAPNLLRRVRAAVKNKDDLVESMGEWAEWPSGYPALRSLAGARSRHAASRALDRRKRGATS